MNGLKNYAEMTFSNPVLIDIFEHYMENSVLASFVSEKGEIHMRFKVNPPVEPPKSCEQVLSLLFALLESNTGSKVGKAYEVRKNEIMRETIFRLSHVLDGFGDAKITIHTTEKSADNPDVAVTKHTEFTLSRKKSDTTVTKTEQSQE